MHSSFSRERGLVWTVRAGLLAWRVMILSAQMRLNLNIRRSRPAFPGLLPVTGGNFLAYSCAAARDSHPLPSPLCEEDARTKGMLGKNENNAEKSNRRGGGCQVSR